MTTLFPEVVVGDRVIARGSGWFHTFQNKKATVEKVTETAVYVKFDHQGWPRGYPKKNWPEDQYFEKESVDERRDLPTKNSI